MKENMICGVHIGEHGFDADGVIAELKERVVDPGYNFVTIRTRARFEEKIAPEVFERWAKYLAENKVYFVFLYSIVSRGKKLAAGIDEECVARIKAAAGEYFLGDMLGELGSCFGAKQEGYAYARSDEHPSEASPYLYPAQNFEDMKSAAEKFTKIVNEYVQICKKVGMPHVFSVEPTALSKYIDAGGVDMPMLELMIAPPDILVSYMRGMARAFGRVWGTYLAHEWYGGVRHSDPLKRKRLSLAAKYAYLAGSSAFCIESGDECISSYEQEHGPDSEICADYREALNYLRDISAEDNRDKAGPRVKLAFVSGRYDPYAGWGGSSAWGQYGREEWGHSDAEHSWRLLHEIGTKRQWWDIENYGDEDTSALPAYGMYDIVPIEAEIDALCRYDYLVFLGWNTMTDEDMDKLTEYVRRGGKLLMSMAHLNYSSRRSGEFIMPPKDKLRALFGADFSGEVRSTNAGVKFADSEMDGVLYPRVPLAVSDPILTAGYVRYAVAEPREAKVLAALSNSMRTVSHGFPPAVLEHRVGKGYAVLLTAMEYPGNGAVYPLYRVLVRELVTASARSADVKVIASDRLRYSVYPDGKMYLLNTDYDLPISVIVRTASAEKKLSLEPLELKIIEL